MNNITIFSRLIQTANSSINTSGYTIAKVSTETTTYNTQNDKIIEKAVSSFIVCGKTKCGNSFYEQCTLENKIRN